MFATDIHTAARSLLDAHGPKAIAEAAQKAKRFKRLGDDEQSRDWKRIEKVLKAMTGPKET